jgi:ATP-dependent DNA helicase DinG
MATLAEMVQTAFGADGPLFQAMVAHRRRYVPQGPQLDYALRAAAAFERKIDIDDRGLVALLEAETGTGKSLGYLVPLSLAVATGKARGLISTFTLLLQRQILGEDFPIAAEVVRLMTAKSVSAAPRLGLRNFMSSARVLELRQAMADEHRLDQTTAQALDSMIEARDGTIRAWVEANGVLPGGVSEADICLLSVASPDAGQFRAHLEVARAADIVVVTHAMLVRSMLRWNQVLTSLGDGGEGSPFSFGVVDEADQLPRVAASVFSVRVSIPMLHSVADTVPGVVGRRLQRAVQQVGDWFDTVREQLTQQAGLHSTGQGDIIVLGAGRTTGLRLAAAGRARDLATALDRAVSPELPQEDAEALRQMSQELQQFIETCDDMSDNHAAALRWSPVRAYAGFSVVPLKPGRLCNRLWRPPAFLRSLVMTSATLDAPAGANPFHQFRSDIGLLGDNYAADISGRFAPGRFGRLRFVLPDPTIPNPTPRRVDELELESTNFSDPVWLDYATAGIAAAATRGGRVLVLTTSFRDTEALATRLRARGLTPLEHRRGERLATVLDLFRADPSGLLLSPAAWEGVNLPGLLSHLVIPRIPFAPTDSVDRYAMLDALVSRGWQLKPAAAVLFRSTMLGAQRRLRQGLGRAIRQTTDDVTAWLLDPRFPLPHKLALREGLVGVGRPMVAFEACIPERFRTGMRATFPAAHVFRAPQMAPTG